MPWDNDPKNKSTRKWFRIKKTDTLASQYMATAIKPKWVAVAGFKEGCSCRKYLKYLWTGAVLQQFFFCCGASLINRYGKILNTRSHPGQEWLNKISKVKALRSVSVCVISVQNAFLCCCDFGEEENRQKVHNADIPPIPNLQTLIVLVVWGPPVPYFARERSYICWFKQYKTLSSHFISCPFGCCIFVYTVKHHLWWHTMTLKEGFLSKGTASEQNKWKSFRSFFQSSSILLSCLQLQFRALYGIYRNLFQPTTTIDPKTQLNTLPYSLKSVCVPCLPPKPSAWPCQRGICL